MGHLAYLLLLPAALFALSKAPFSLGGSSSTPNIRPATPGGGLEMLRRWADLAESATGMTGFSQFALAAAYTESRGDNLVARGRGPLPPNVELNEDSNEAKAACALFLGAKGRGFYAHTRYPKAWWCIGSGGWFGMMPATGLSAAGTDGPFSKSSPFLIFEPIESVVMLADLVARTVWSRAFQSLPEDEQNWLAIRRGMASNRFISDYDESYQRSSEVRERLEAALIQTDSTPDLAFRAVAVAGYPGAGPLYTQLRAAMA